MSNTEQEKKQTSRRLRRQRKGDISGDTDTSSSGSESDTIFEEASDYESAEDHESVEGTPKQQKEAERQTGEQHEDVKDTKETDELVEEVAALNISPKEINDEDDGRLGTLDDNLHAQDEEDVIDQNKDADDQEDVKVEDDDNEDVKVEDDAEDELSEHEEEDEDALEEKRESGDGQEEPAEEEAELDDDEDLKNPAYIPRRGAYYQHDVRNDDQKGGDKRQRRDRRLWKEDGNKWFHDKYDEAEQGPKSHYELINYHGFDVRDPTQQDRVDSFQPRRGRGRGIRGGGRRNDGEMIGRGRGRGKRLQRPPYDDEGGGDRQGRERQSTVDRTSKSRPEQDFPELPSRGEGDQRHSPKSESVVSYAERTGAHRNQIETENEGIRIKYQSDKTYYEKDSVGDREESYRNVTADYRYRPSVHRSMNTHAYHPTSNRENDGVREKPTKDWSFGDSKQFYQLEFVNKNYQNESEGKIKNSQTPEDYETEEMVNRSSEHEALESRKAYSSERHQRSRAPPQDSSTVIESSPSTVESTGDDKPLLNIHNLKIQVKGTERLVHYQEKRDQAEERFPEDNNDEAEEEEEPRTDKRERSRPKRYSSQRQRAQDQPSSSSSSSHYYGEDVQSSSQSSVGKPATDGPQGVASQRSASQRSPGQTSISRQAPTAHGNQGLQSSLPPNLSSLMQQGLMMPPDGQMPHGVRAPHLPSPAFFQQHQGNMPPPYYVGPMVNYGAPQYPMGAPLQFQHFSMGMPPSPQTGVPPPAAPPPPPPAPPQSAAGPPSSSSQNPSVQQVGGVTYYSPMQQPLQIRHPPPKRQSKPLTIESPPEVKLLLH